MFADEDEPHKPDDKEEVGEYLVEPWKGEEEGDKPEDEVHIEQEVPNPFAVVEGECRRPMDFHLRVCGADGEVYAAPQGYAPAELDAHLVAARGKLQLVGVGLHGACIEAVDEEQVGQPRLIESSLVNKGQCGHSFFIR